MATNPQFLDQTITMIVSMLRNSSHVNSPVFRQTQWLQVKTWSDFLTPKWVGFTDLHIFIPFISGSISMFLDQIYEIPWKNPMSDG
jgi:hypothetical protein